MGRAVAEDGAKFAMRRIGKEGTVTLPKRWREELGIKPGDQVRLVVRNGVLYIAGVQTRLDFSPDR